MKERTSSIPSSSSSTTTTAKRLLFDRRYGWVIDEWKDPSEEALSGGRGMFCVIPLAKALLKVASQSINVAASPAVKALESPDLFSAQVLQVQASLTDQLHKIKSSLFHKGNLSSKSNDTACSSESQIN